MLLGLFGTESYSQLHTTGCPPNKDSYVHSRNNQVFEEVVVAGSLGAKCRGSGSALTSKIQEGPPPTHSTESWVHEARGVSRETFSVRDPRCHFSESAHDEVADHAHDAVSEEETQRPSSRESGSGADNQTSPYGASDGNHGDLARVETPVQRLVLCLGRGAVKGLFDDVGALLVLSVVVACLAILELRGWRRVHLCVA